jgi:hypothetical protein
LEKGLKGGRKMSATNLVQDVYYLDNNTTNFCIDYTPGYYRYYPDIWPTWYPYTVIYRGEKEMDKTGKILEIVKKMSELGIIDLKKLTVEDFIKLMNELNKIL